MLSFELGKSYRFRSSADAQRFESLVVVNRKVSAAIGHYSNKFTIIELSPTGSVRSIRLDNGKIITAQTLNFDSLEVDVIIAYDESEYFEAVETVPVKEMLYDVMTSNSSQTGFTIRHVGVSYDEAVKWASEYIEDHDGDEFAYVIHRTAKVTLRQEPVVVVDTL